MVTEENRPFGLYEEKHQELGSSSSERRLTFAHMQRETTMTAGPAGWATAEVGAWKEWSVRGEQPLGDLDPVERCALPQVVPTGEEQECVVVPRRLTDPPDEHLVATCGLER